MGGSVYRVSTHFQASEWDGRGNFSQTLIRPTLPSHVLSLPHRTLSNLIFPHLTDFCTDVPYITSCISRPYHLNLSSLYLIRLYSLLSISSTSPFTLKHRPFIVSLFSVPPWPHTLYSVPLQRPSNLSVNSSLIPCRPGMVPGSTMRECSIHTVLTMPNNADQIFMCSKSSQAYLMTASGQVIRTFSSGMKHEVMRSVCMCMYVCVCVCMWVCACVCVCMCMCVCVGGRVCGCVGVSSCVCRVLACICLYVRACACMYVYVYVSSRHKTFRSLATLCTNLKDFNVI